MPPSPSVFDKGDTSAVGFSQIVIDKYFIHGSTRNLPHVQQCNPIEIFINRLKIVVQHDDRLAGLPELLQYRYNRADPLIRDKIGKTGVSWI